MQDLNYDFTISLEELANLPEEIKKTVIIIINGEYYKLKEEQK